MKCGRRLAAAEDRNNACQTLYLGGGADLAVAVPRWPGIVTTTALYHWRYTAGYWRHRQSTVAEDRNLTGIIIIAVLFVSRRPSSGMAEDRNDTAGGSSF